MTQSGSLFARQISELGLAEEAELSTILAQLPPDKRDDAQAAAKLLVDRGKVTKYQAAAVYQGKGKSLVYGDYVVLDRIGAGGMGQVFKARHRRMDRIVALKVMSIASLKNPDSVRRFEREVKAAAKLSHPNVVTAHDAGMQDGVHYLVMEFVDGCDLSSLMKRQNKFSVRQACDFIAQAARGLAFAHAKGVVHRDIKPANLLVGADGVVKILDLGLARFDDGPGGGASLEEAELTQNGTVMGTVDYMAPEQALNTRHADAKSDVYGLGCTLYRLLTGDAPYHGETMVEKIMAHRDQPIPSIRRLRPDVPPAVENIFARMVAKRPEARPTMQEVAEGLGSLDLGAAGSSGIGLTKLPTATATEATYVGPLPTATPTVAAPFTTHIPTGGPRSKPLPRRRQSQLPLLLVVLVAAAALGGGGWFYLQKQNQTDLAATNHSGENGAAIVDASPIAVTPPAVRPSPSPSASSATSGNSSNLFTLPTAIATGGPAPNLPTKTASTGSPPPVAGSVDLLALLQLPQNVVAGPWARSATALLGDGVGSRVQAPYSPPADEYDVVLTGKLVSAGLGNTSGLAIGLVSRGRQYHMRLGRTGCGISDGNAYKPPHFLGNLNLPLTETFTAICAVRRDSVRLDLNGQTLLKYDGSFTDLQINRAWPLPKTDQLYLLIDGDDRWEISTWRVTPPSIDPPATAIATSQLAAVPSPAMPSATAPATIASGSPPAVATPLSMAPPVDFAPPPVVFDAATELAVAQAICNAGGTVIVNVDGRQLPRIKNAPLLPTEPFYIVTVGYSKLRSLTDADFTRLQKLGGVKTVELNESNATDQGITALSSLKTLEVLNLGKSRVRGAGLGSLTQLPNLKELRINEIGMDDAGAQSIRLLKNLEKIEISNNQKLTSAAFANGLMKLRDINMVNTGVRDFTPFGVLPELTNLGIGSTPITDASLATLPNFPKLNRLVIANPNVTDAGLRYLERFTTLTLLITENTYVSDAAATQWMSKFPSCRITWKPKLGTPPAAVPLPPVPTMPPPSPVTGATTPGAFFATAPATPAARHPVPDAEAKKAAMTQIKEVYRDDYAATKTPEQKAAFGVSLLGVARQTADDPVARYVLLDEARILAIDAGDANTLRDALIALSRDYQVDEASTFLDSWNELVRRPRDVAIYRSLFNEAVSLFDEAVTYARFDDAKRYADFATPTAARLKDAALTKQMNERNAALLLRRKEWETVKAAADKLATTPDDPEANLTCGRYLALSAGEWPQAFALLARGSDEVLKELAAKSVAATLDPAGQLALGDAWWDAAQAAKVPQRNDLLAGAHYWYGLAAPTLSGIQRSRVDKRLSDAALVIPSRKIPPTRLDLRAAAGAPADDRPVMPVRNFGDPK